jgi:carbonic anhydrase/acetyltransferase-like protein (isoleucine patch superfamily)
MKGAHIGHGAVVHGATIGKNVLVGMNAVVMDNVIVGDGSIIGALTFVPEGMKIPGRKVVVGNPARIVKDVSDEMLKWKSEGTKLYQSLPEEMRKHWNECVPLNKALSKKPAQKKKYSTWGNKKAGR